VTYTIAADALNGCYSWNLTAYSRAFSPNDSNGLTDIGGHAWNYVQRWVGSNALTSVGVITLPPGGGS
jgi:formylglycine-generating enzyme required for sulfatase activity